MTAMATKMDLAPPTAREITLARPIIGFGEDRQYLLRSIDARYAPYLSLGSVRDSGPQFIVVAPGLIFPDYVIEVPEADADLLGLSDPRLAEVLGLVTRRDKQVPTVNLLGPLVINWSTGIGAQVVLADSDYSAAVPVDQGSARRS